MTVMTADPERGGFGGGLLLAVKRYELSNFSPYSRSMSRLEASVLMTLPSSLMRATQPMRLSRLLCDEVLTAPPPPPHHVEPTRPVTSPSLR